MRTILIIIYMLFLLIFSSFMIIVDKITTINADTVYKKIRNVANTLNKLAGNDYEIIGVENIPDKPSLIVANHESVFDPVLILSVFEPKVAVIGKIELTKIPTLKYWVSKFGCEFIERDNLRQSVKVISNASKTLQTGTNILIFPEGTRNKKNEEFKAGSFKIAQMAKADIVPITVENTSNLFENNKYMQIKSSKTKIIIHKPISYESYHQKDLVTVANEVQTIVNNG